ncbi:MAG: translocation/assembly module TamB [Schleiferiaceae bacterium]|nr:translocation/assembly module TamB [Schleiferiaceae bacterium]
MVFIAVVIVLAVSVIFSFTAVQSWVGKKAVTALNQHYNTTIQFERLKYTWPNHIELFDVYVPDLTHGDTLLVMKRLKTQFLSYSTQQNFLKLGYVSASDVYINMMKYDSDSLFNSMEFINCFLTEDASEMPPFKMSVPAFRLANIRYNKLQPDCDWCTQIQLTEALLSGKNFTLDSLDIALTIHEMKYKDRDRFDLKHLCGTALWTPEMVIVDSLIFRTDASRIRLEGVMQTDSLKGYANYLTQVKHNVSLQAPAVSSREFQMWIPQFPDFGTFAISGKAGGTVLDFSTTDVAIQLGNATQFYGAVALKNCTDPSTLYLNAKAQNLTTTPKDMEQYLFQFFDTVPDFDYAQLGTLTLTGDYVGTIEDFRVSGGIASAYGQLQGDLVLSDLRDLDKVAYEGRLAFKDFALDRFTSEQRFGKMNAIGVIKGEGINKANLRSLVDLRISKLEFNNYAYSNIMANGFVADQLFSGKLTAKDPHFDFDFEGTVGFQSDSTVFDFNAVLYHANLFALNFSTKEIAICSGTAKIDFNRTESSDWLGQVLLSEIQYEDQNNLYFFEKLEVKSEISKAEKRFSVLSDLFDAALRGRFQFDELLAGIQYVGQSIYPPLAITQTKMPEYVTANLRIKNAKLFYNLFLPKFYASRNTNLSITFDASQDYFATTFEAPELFWDSHQFFGVEGRIAGTLSQLQSEVQLQHYKKGEFFLDALRIVTQQMDTVTNLTLSNLGAAADNAVAISGSVTFKSDDEIEIALNPGYFNVIGSTFTLERENILRIQEDRIEVIDFELSQDAGRLALNGVVSKNPYEILRVEVHNMPLDILNGALDFPFLLFKGTINGELLGSDVFKAPKFFADLVMDSLFVNEQFVGEMRFNSFWDIQSSLVNFDGGVVKEADEQLTFNGTFRPDDDQEILLTAGFNRFEANFLDPIFKDVFSDIRSTINGRFQMSGPIRNPSFESKLELAAMQLTIPYLNTRYDVVGSPEIEISSSRIDLGEFGIKDATFGTTGRVSGWLEHRVFRDFKFDVRVMAENLLALNTAANTANYYYGTAFAKGFVELSGTPENLIIKMDATSVGNSKINIPLDNPTEISQQSFITFVKTDDSTALGAETIGGIEGVTLDLSFNMTPSAEVTLQLDPTAGGAIRGRGNGRIRLLMDASGELEMFGNYQIESGEYQFVLQRIVNKPFKVAQGSSISWNGDPFNALLDLRAVYATRTSLTGVVTNTAYRGNRVNVDLNLLLSGYLLDTDIQFDIQLPQSDPAFQEELNSRFNDPDKLNEQAFSLLVYNSFFDPGLGAGGNIGNLAGTALGANAMQGLSAQVSNFLNKGAGDWVDINVAYNPGGVNTAAVADPLLQSQEEIALDLSRQFFDDRIVVNSVFDVPVGANPNRLAGNISVEYKITPDGRIRTKFFNRSNLDNPYVDQLAPYSQGVGIFYRKDFDTLRFWRLKQLATKPKDDETDASDAGKVMDSTSEEEPGSQSQPNTTP